MSPTCRWRSICTVAAPLAPYPFQLAAVPHLLGRSRRGLLLADEMGLGKTVSVAAALNRAPDIQSVLIVAPKSVVPVWKYELSRWLERPLTIDVATAGKGMPEEAPDILLINYEMVPKLREELEGRAPWDALVCDEAHYLKNPKAKRTLALLGKTCRPKDLRNNPLAPNNGAMPARRVWFLSGSPILNSPIELYPLLRTLDPKGATFGALKSFNAFCERYSNRIESDFGVSYKGARNTGELQALLKKEPPLMLRRTKAEVLPQLPPKRHALFPLTDDAVSTRESKLIREALLLAQAKAQAQAQAQATGEAKGASDATADATAAAMAAGAAADAMAAGATADAMAADATAGLEGAEISAEVASVLKALERAPERGWSPEDLLDRARGSGRILGLLAQARHATARAKVDHAVELLRSALVEHKVVVFAHHRDVQDALLGAFRGSSVGVSGGTKPAEREEAVRKFQEEEETRLFVGSIRAAGVGLTLTAASHVLFVEFDWSPTIMQQAEDRCHRIGQQADSVLVQYLYFENTVDEFIAKLCAKKLSAISASLDGQSARAAAAEVARSHTPKAPRLHTPAEEAVGGPAYVLQFGKHKGRRLADVPREYLEWLAKSGVASEMSRTARVQRNRGLEGALGQLGFTCAVAPVTRR